MFWMTGDGLLMMMLSIRRTSESSEDGTMNRITIMEKSFVFPCTTQGNGLISSVHRDWDLCAIMVSAEKIFDTYHFFLLIHLVISDQIVKIGQKNVSVGSLKVKLL